MSSPRVFISYSHDTEAHKERVRRLADRLRNDAVDAWLDQYETSPPEGWPRWMRNQIERAEFVLAVCTKIFGRRFEGKEVPGRGLGVQWEGKILTTSLYEAAKNRTLIPVVFEKEDKGHIPIVLRDVTYYDLSADDGYEQLYRRLTGQPLIKAPPLGIRKVMPLMN